MRIVLDTNVLLSGLMLPESVPGKIIQAWREARFDLVLSDQMLEEIGRSLSYPKIRRRIRWGKTEISNFLLLLRFKAVIVDISGVKADVPSDPDDAHVMATFIAGEAEALVTGDKDLLDLAGQYPILTPREFADRL